MDTDEDIALGAMNVDVAVLPEQFFGEPQKEWSGTHRLAYAVLYDAYFVYSQGPGSHRVSHRDREEVIRWFFTDKETIWPFSFVNICHLLGLSPEYLRRGLQHAALYQERENHEQSSHIKRQTHADRHKKGYARANREIP